jgi:hypothetical protein
VRLLYFARSILILMGVGSGILLIVMIERKKQFCVRETEHDGPRYQTPTMTDDVSIPVSSHLVDPTGIWDDSQEPLLQENKERFVLFPIKYRKIWDMVCKFIFSVNMWSVV